MKIINSKVFKIIIALFIVGIFLGMISFLIISKTNNYLVNYFDMIKKSNINYFNSLISITLYNFKYNIVIWLSGLIFMFSFIIPLIILYKGISIGYTFLYLLYIFHLKGIIIALILLIPCILINSIIYIFMSYYSVNFAFKTYNIFVKNKTINLKGYIKNYFLQLCIFLFILLLTSLFETYITSNILKYVL